MRGTKAFTLVEMLIVVLILGAVAAIAIPRITNASKAAKDRACKTNVDIMNRQIELFHLNTGSWPQQLADVTGNTDYFPDGPPECPFGWEYEMSQDNYRVIKHGDHSDEVRDGEGSQNGDDDDSQGSQRGRRRRGRRWW